MILSTQFSKKYIVLLFSLILGGSFAWSQTTFTTAGSVIPPAGGIGLDTTVCIPIQVMNNNVPLDGVNGLSACCISINHPQAQDLVAYLISPSGSFMPLFWSATGAMNGTYCFKDSTLLLTLSANAPGSYLPEFPLGNANDGQTSTGIWELCIVNNGTLPGSIANYSLTLGGGNVAPPVVSQGNNNCLKEGCNFRSYDSGGPIYGYLDDEILPETFCPPADGLCSRITFTSIDIEADGTGGCFDFLDVWDGEDFGAPNVLLSTVCGSGGSTASFTSTTGCLTTVFVSDYIVGLTGWDSFVDCVPCAAAVESTRPANDDCVSAIPLNSSGNNINAVGCDVDGAAPWVADSCDWFSTENSVFYSVTVTGTTPQPVQVELLNVSCTGGANELQMALFDANCATVGTYGANYHGCASGVDTVTLVANNSSLAAGNYILVVDGNAGAECTWDVQSPLLAVEWVDLNGYYIGEEEVVELGWTTANEINNAGFNVEKSTDRQTWSTLDFVYPSHSERSIRNYRYRDNITQKEDIYYYRLKQIDTDGKTTYSNIIEVKLQDWDDIELISQYPNPVKDEFHLQLFAKQSGNAHLQIANTLGQVVHSEEWELGIGGEHMLTAHLANVDEGLYHYYLKVGPKTFGGKVLIDR